MLTNVNLRTRVAPSPTGDFHLGTARTAYFNWLAAKASDGKFILRIDDTDDARNSEESVKVIYESMEWLQLDYDKSFRQSTRTARYVDIAQRLLKSGHGYQIDGGAICLSPPTNVPIIWTDICRGDIRISQQDRDTYAKLVLLRSDGKPTYHFATVVDDHDYGINYIIRGADHLSNTAKHVAIYTALEWPLPQWAHVGLIMTRDESGKPKKLSKRDAAASLNAYKNYHVEALLAWLLRVGWGPKIDNKENSMILRGRAVKMFIAEGHMKANPAMMDENKLKSFERKVRSTV